MKDFQGRVAVVTGAASGIGYALAERFAAEGMKLAIADIHEEALDAAASRLREGGAEVVARPTDVTDAAAVEDLAQQVYREYGAAHLVCNNAGLAAVTPDPTWELSLETWRAILNVNFFGIVHGIRAFVPRMLEAGSEGHILNTASMAGLNIGGATMGPYSASKHAVVSVTESLYGELKAANASVSASVLCPGWVNTDLGANSARELSRASGEAPVAISPFAMATMPGVVEPPEVARRVIDGLREDRFYIVVAAEEALDRVRLGHRRIEDGQNPAVAKTPWDLNNEKEAGND